MMVGETICKHLNSPFECRQCYPVRCAACGSPCQEKFNSGDPAFVCENDECRQIQGQFHGA